MAGGRTLLVSLDSKDTSYASIAAGSQDTAIMNFLKAVNQAAIKYNLGSIYVTFEHEPDNESHRSLGPPAQFVQAWDHVHQLAVSAHLDWNDGGRLHWVLILIHDTYSSWRMGEFWPGNSEVDLVAADGYNSFGCGSGGQKQPQTPTDTFGPILSFAASHGNLPVFLGEWGSDDIPSGEQATYINQMQSYVASNSEIAGAMYWDTHVGNCNYKVDGNSASISALAAMGQSTALQGQV
jgi:beta-mannanase